MIIETFKGMIYNAALLLALSVVFDSIVLSRYREKTLIRILTGISLGILTMAIMVNPFVLKTGVVFDTRTILLSLSALFFGLLPAIIAAGFGIFLRIIQGGAGVYTGCSTIVAAVFWGFVWRTKNRTKEEKHSFTDLLNLGIVTHVTMLLTMFLLPASIRWSILADITLPVMVIYPLVTVVLGQILARRQTKQQEKEMLEQSEKQFRSLYQHAPIAYQSLDAEGLIVSVNKHWLRSLGYEEVEVIGKSFSEFLDPLYIQKFITSFPVFLANGEVEGIEYVLRRKDKSKLLVSFNGNILRDIHGNFVCTQCVFTDLTELRKQESELRSIEWMLSKTDDTKIIDTEYGDLTLLNTERLILDSVGKEVLTELAGDYLSLLDTSSAVYEKNGDYAIGFFRSGWCQFLDLLSRKLCDTDDNREALDSGMWLCHESCWTEVSKVCIETGEIVDKECLGGLRLYCVPIVNSSGIIGAINMGYGSPPDDPVILQEIAERYKVEVNELLNRAKSYHKRPAFVVEQAKRKLRTAAKIIGEIVERKQAEIQRNRYSDRLEILRELDRVVLETLSLETICNTTLQNLQKLIPFNVATLNVFKNGLLELVALNTSKGTFPYLQPGTNYPPDSTFVSSLINHSSIIRSALCIEDVSIDMPVAQKLVQDGMKSFMYNTIAIKEDLYGFLWFASDQVDFFNHDYEDIAQEFANQLAVILQHLRMVDTIRDHSMLLETKIEERTAQLKTANQELEAFSYSAAHDLRSPLRVIDGYARAMLEDYGHSLDFEVRQSLHVIIETTHKMDTLINELIQLGRLSHETLKKTSYNMHDQVSEILGVLLAKYKNEGFTVELNDLSDSEADRTLIGQVWQNLIDNAFKFTVPCTVKQIKIGARLDTFETIYYVQDTGVGFDLETTNQIFEPFRRFHKDTINEGSGIGLAIVKKIINHHNGRVWAESASGKGTTVYFSLPR